MDFPNENLRKCAELYSLDRRRLQAFVIKCSFCGETTEGLDKFSQHYEEKHLDNLLPADADISYESIKVEERLESDLTLPGSDKNLIENTENCFIKEEEFIDIVDDSQDCSQYQEISKDFPSYQEECNQSMQSIEDLTQNSTQANDLKDEENFIIRDDSSNDLNDCPLKKRKTDFHNENDLNVRKEDLTSSQERCTQQNSFPSQRKSILKILEENKDLVSFLIDAFRNEPILWDSGKQYDYRKKSRIFSGIVDLVQEKLSYKIKAEVLKELLRYFRSVRQAWETFPNRSGEIPWFLSKLDFLKVTKTKKLTLSSSKTPSAKAALPVGNFTDEETIRLIQIYQGFACLWNTEVMEYRLIKYKEKALRDMQEAFEKEFPTKTNIRADVLMHQIRLACSQEKHRQLHAEKTNTSYKPKCKFYKYWLYLQDHVGPFKCPICSEVKIASDSFKIHKASHDGSTPFQCEICPKNFHRRETFVFHLKRHMLTNSFQCRVCDEEFISLKYAEAHVRSHLGKSVVECQPCNRFLLKDSCCDHTKQYAKFKGAFKCGLCNDIHANSLEFENHMRKHSPQHAKKCGSCSKGFTCIALLRQHERVHDRKDGV